MNDLVSMAWDNTKRPRYLDSLVAYVERRVVTDLTDPFLAYLGVQKVVTAAAVGFPPDSTAIERLTTVCTTVAQAGRDSLAGVYAVLGVSYYYPVALHSLAVQLGNSIAGRVATALLKEKSPRN